VKKKSEQPPAVSTSNLATVEEDENMLSSQMNILDKRQGLITKLQSHVSLINYKKIEEYTSKVCHSEKRINYNKSKSV
jgi:hypothetical protein